MEDFKKKYNEALDWMRKKYPTLMGANKEDAEHYFPELKESEDERIRKALIRFFKNTHDWVNLKYDGDEIVAYLEKQKEQKPIMIQWTGKNLKEVIDFTGKSPKFGEWFNSWKEFETYVHQHNDILKLFCEDGSHYEVPVGAWIVKTPDGYNVPSAARFIPAKQEQPEVDLEKELDRYLRGEFQQTAGGNFNNYIQVACHFWNMGYNAGKED